MARWLKITIRVSATLLIFLCIVWMAAAYYLHRNNQQLLSRLVKQLNQELTGQIAIDQMETTLLRSFPGVSLSLKNVLIKDSLWQQHRHDLLRAKDIEVSLNVLSLLTGKINIRKIRLHDAQIYLYTDSNGYSNSTVLSKEKTETNPTEPSKEAIDLQIRRIDFKNTELVIDNQRRHKRFHFLVSELNGRMTYPDTGWNGQIKLKTQIKSFAFNTQKGSFLKDKSLQGTLQVHYKKAEKVVVIDQDLLYIGKDPFYIGAKIHTGSEREGFEVAIRADQILYRDLSLLLAPNISDKLLKFSIEKPIDVTGSIIDDGSQQQGDPLIRVRMNVKDNIVRFPSGELTDCQFTGTFTNEEIPGKGIGDENSVIRFFQLKGAYFNAPIQADTVSITNLSRPVATALVTSDFPLERLNESLGGDHFLFKKGTATVKLYCKADIEHFLFTKPEISGLVAIKNADITYLPRNLHLINSALNLNFNQKDLHITSSRFQLGKSILHMNCDIQHFLNFYYTDPEKIEVNLQLKSPQLQLNEFIPFLGPRQKIKRKTSQKNTLKAASDQLADVLEASRINLRLNVDKAIYKRFVASGLQSDISLIGDGVFIRQFKVNHAGGQLQLTGQLRQTGTVNKFTIRSTVRNVNVKDFFYAFEDFGQTSVSHKNLQGFLSSTINASGSITDKGVVVKRSMYGKVNFHLNKAALIGFEPMGKVGKFAFPNRDLNHIEIPRLEGVFTLNGDKINISPMEVNSSVLNFNVRGVYGINEGTNIAMDIPLRNPKRDEKLESAEARQEARMKGIVLRLKAVEEEGKLKIRWNKDRDKASP